MYDIKVGNLTVRLPSKMYAERVNGMLEAGKKVLITVKKNQPAGYQIAEVRP